MSQVHVTSGSSSKWIVVGGVVVLALGAAAYWFMGSDEGGEPARVTDAASSAPSAAPQPSVPLTEFANPNPTVEEAQRAIDQQKEAAKVIEAKPDMKPLVGPITERPDFVSPMEWAMLQGVVQQHAQPDKELTRMVNFLRFMKQMEAYEALPKVAENAAKRQVLAAQLVEDLPNRVRGGDLEIKDAQARLAEWLPEAIPDPQQRQQRAEKIGQMMAEAADTYKAAEAAELAAKQRQQ